MRIAAEGDTFKRRKPQAEDIKDYPIERGDDEGEIDDQDD